METFSSVHVFDVRLFRAIKGVFSLLTLACFFTEKSRCSGCRVNQCRQMWAIYTTSVTLTLLVNAGNVKGDDSVRKDDWFGGDLSCSSVIRNKTLDSLSDSRDFDCCDNLLIQFFCKIQNGYRDFSLILSF